MPKSSPKSPQSIIFRPVRSCVTSQVRPFRKWAKRSKYCTSRLASSVSRLSFRRLQYETLEARQLLSAANPAQQLTLADLPVAAHEAISAADQFTYISTTKGASASLLAGPREHRRARVYVSRRPREHGRGRGRRAHVAVGGDKLVR